jgi:isopentenyl-diphosphate delta-isomerase
MSEKRKQDHLDLTFKSQVTHKIENEFYYEPLLGSHQIRDLSTTFIGHKLKAPLWVSSMTGGTEKAKLINKNLARACGKFGLGMGLGSCRSLLFSNERIEDFDVKKEIGEFPLYANLGIAQISQLISNNQLSLVDEMIKKLNADGLIIHINPLQEAMQEEGDFLNKTPLDILNIFFDQNKVENIIIKEVGQGFGPNSLKLLLEMPIKAIELAGFGGTNFTYLEQARHSKSESGRKEPLKDFAHIGHTASEMISWINTFIDENKSCNKEIIISGGVKSILNGYFLKERCNLNSLIGFASPYLKYALEGEQALEEFISEQIYALNLAENFILRK